MVRSSLADKAVLNNFNHYLQPLIKTSI